MYMCCKKKYITCFLLVLCIGVIVGTKVWCEGESDAIYADNKTVNSSQSANALHGGPKTEIPSGMEVIYISGVRYVVPKGAKVSKEFGYNQVEPITLYSARKFEDMEKRIEKLEQKVKDLEEEIEEMNKNKPQEQVAE